MKTSLMSVSIIIPNWNGAELLKKHLPYIIKNCHGAEIIIVDDCSTDESVSYIQKNFPYIRIIKKIKHEGFASAVNRGVQEANTDIVVLLNTDVEPEKGFLIPLLSRFSDPNMFAVGCMDKSIENRKTVLRGRGIGWWEKGFYMHKKGEVDKSDTAWVSGGSGAFRRSVWHKLGGMDPLFNPFYWEDIDLSHRAVEKGYAICFEPKSIVRHYHEEGLIKASYSQNQIQMIAYRNQFIFIWKHAPVYQLLLGAVWIPVRMIQTLLNGNMTMVHGLCQACPFFGPILVRRIMYFFSRKGICRYFH